MNSNCEHFVTAVTGFEIKSNQVQSGVAGALVGAGLVGGMSENPTFLKLLTGAVVVAGIAVIATGKAEKRKAWST